MGIARVLSFITINEASDRYDRPQTKDLHLNSIIIRYAEPYEGRELYILLPSFQTRPGLAFVVIT